MPKGRVKKSLDILATQVIEFVNSKYGVTNLADTPTKCGNY